MNKGGRVILGLAFTLLATGAGAQMRQCSDQRVEYLVGGAAKGGSAAGRTCSSLIVGGPAAPLAAGSGPRSNAAAGDGALIARPDEEGRRDILTQELRKERQALADLDRSQAAVPGAGTLQEQRIRHQGDIASLESELARLKR